MRRTNRVEPVNTGNNANDLARATMTTTTRMEFVRRVQVLPMEEAVAQLHGDLNQSLSGEATISPRIWTGMQRPTTPVAIRGTRRAVWCIGCVFITVGLLALLALVVGLTIAFGATNAIGESDIERYDVGDLHYGVDNVDAEKFPSNTYLSVENKAAVQTYLSDQLSSEPGYRGLVIDGVLVQQQTRTGRKRRDTSCDAIFVVRNIQIYFDHCSTCAGSRNLALRRVFSNITAFQQPLELLLNSNGSTSKVAAEICSAPTISRLIIPVRLSILQAREINSSLVLTTTHSTTTEIRTDYPTYTYTVRPSTIRSSYIFTSRSLTTQKVTSMRKASTMKTSTIRPIETTLSLVTTIASHISSELSTISPGRTTDSMLTSEMTITEGITQRTDASTLLNEIDKTTTEQSEDTTIVKELESTSSSVSSLSSSSLSSIEGISTTETSDNVSEHTTLDAIEDTTYMTDFTSLSTDTSTFEANSTIEFEEIATSSSSLIDFTSEETSTIDFIENTTTAGIEEFETTSSNDFTDMTKPATTDLLTISDTTTESDLFETTSNSEDIDSNSTSEILSTTVVDDYPTETTFVSDSTTDEIATDLTTDIQSSTMSSYKEETSLLPVYIPTTMKQTTSLSRQTTKKISPFLPYKPSSFTSARRDTSRQQATQATSLLPSVKPSRTRKQTYYSTVLVSPTTQHQSISRIITSTNTYRPTTATFPMTTATRQRGRSKVTTNKLKQTTNYPTTIRPQTTMTTHHTTTTTIEEDYTSISSTDMMATDGTITTDRNIEMSSISTSSEIQIDDLETTSFTLNEEQATERLLKTDLTSTIFDELSTDETYTTVLQLNSTITTTPKIDENNNNDQYDYED